MSEDFPVAEVQAADDERAAAGDFVEPILRLEPDSPLRHDLPEMEGLAEGAAEIFPHVGCELFAFVERHLGESERKILQRALLPVKAGRDQAPQVAGMARRGLERIGARDRLQEAESHVFQAKAQILGERHQSAGPIGSQGRKRLIAQAPPHCQAGASGGVSGATFVTFLV